MNSALSRKIRAKIRLPSGNGFMPQVRRNRLVKMAMRSREGVEKSKLLAARMRKEGKSIRIMKDRYRNRLGRYDRINNIVCGVVNRTTLMKRAGTLWVGPRRADRGRGPRDF